MSLVVLVALLLIVAHHRLRPATATDPAVIHATVWAAAALGSAVFPELAGFPSWTTIFVLIAAMAAFSAGIAAAERIPSHGAATTFPSAPWPVWLPAVLALVSIFGLIAVAYRAHQLVPMDGRADWMPRLRLAVTGQGQSFGWAGYVANLGLASTFVGLSIARSRSDAVAATIALLAAVVTALLLTGRTYILLLAVLTVVAIGIQHRAPRITRMVVAGTLTLILFALLVTTAARYLSGLTVANGAVTVYVHLLHYIPAGIIGFDAQVADESSLTYGIYTFRTVLAVLKALGADVTVVDLVRPYIQSPISTNVYTALSPYYADFGIIGVVVFFFGFGCLTGWCWRQTRRRADPRWSMLYAILLYAMVMQFFQDQYLSLLSNWVQLLFWTILLTSVPRRPAQ